MEISSILFPHLRGSAIIKKTINRKYIEEDDIHKPWTAIPWFPNKLQEHQFDVVTGTVWKIFNGLTVWAALGRLAAHGGIEVLVRKEIVSEKNYLYCYLRDYLIAANATVWLYQNAFLMITLRR